MKIATVIVLAAIVVGTSRSTITEDELDRLLGKSLKERLLEFIQSTEKPQASRGNLACPIPQTWFHVERTEPECTTDVDCGLDEKCCDWSENQHCLRGIDMTPRSGECPRLSMWNDACLADHVSCRYDAECHGDDEKCCMNNGCGYADCQSVRQNLACPTNVFLDANSTTSNCTKDSECELTEKCCEVDGHQICLEGIDTLPKPGFCPPLVSNESPSCEANHTECDYDSQCPGANYKCCMNTDCNYRDCIDMNRDFACPWLNKALPEVNNITTPSSCTPTNATCPGFGMLCCATGLTPARDLVHNCVPAILHRPKPGTCPPAEVLRDPNGGCIAGYEGNCRYDDDCGSTHKCCETACGHRDCVRLPSRNPTIIERVMKLLGEN